MWTNPEILLKVLLSNRIGSGYFITCKVDISSPKYWVRPLTENQNKLFQIILDLRNEGLTFPEISDFLNSDTDLTPIRSKRKFYPPLVWSMWDKITKRKERISQINKLRIYDIGLMIE
jgi:hypothetical protein